MEGSWKALTKKHGVFDVQCKAKCSAGAGCVLSMVNGRGTTGCFMYIDLQEAHFKDHI